MKRTAALALAAFALAASAATPPTPPPSSIYGPPIAPVTASSTPSRVTLNNATNSTYPVISVCNVGASVGQFKLGNSSVTAGSSDTTVQPGYCVPQWTGQGYVSLYSALGTTFQIYQSNGAPNLSGGGGGGGGGSGGSVTQGTVPWIDNIAQLGGNAIATGAGVSTTGTQRVTIATDDTVAITGTVTANLGTLNGAATAANQTTMISDLASLVTNTTGLATATAQTTGNGYLSTIATNSGTAATSANQSTMITDLASIITNQTNVQANAGSSASKAVAIQGLSGGVSIAALLQSGSTTIVTQATGTNLHMVCDSGCSGSGGTSSSFGSAFPATGTAMGFRNGSGNMDYALVNASHYLDAALTNDEGSVAAGTAASNSLLMGGIYNSSPITMTAGQQAAAQFDQHGYLLVNVATATGVAQGSTTSGQSISPIGVASVTNCGTGSFTNGQTNMATADLLGNTCVKTSPQVVSMVSGTASQTSTTSTSLVSAVTSKSLYITAFSCSNSGSTTNVVSFQDGSGGTTLWTVVVPAGGGNNLAGTMPMFKTTAGNALYFAPSAASTTTYCSASGFSQ